VLEILGSLFFGTTIVMLHPYGNMDLGYFIHTLQNKQITYIMAVPTFLNQLYDFIENTNGLPLSNIRSLCSAGK
jgi:acyl-coenzyme A synthetase/AMP-(fatty) acid ligase